MTSAVSLYGGRFERSATHAKKQVSTVIWWKDASPTNTMLCTCPASEILLPMGIWTQSNAKFKFYVLLTNWHFTISNISSSGSLPKFVQLFHDQLSCQQTEISCYSNGSDSLHRRRRTGGSVVFDRWRQYALHPLVVSRPLGPRWVCTPNRSLIRSAVLHGLWSRPTHTDHRTSRPT